MKKELRDKWVAALRSGEYEQTKGVLHNSRTGGYCCLGVLCVVSGDPRWDGHAMEGNEYYLESEAASRFGVYGVTGTLAGLNDEGNKSFQEIADYIEQNIPVEGE